MKYSRPTPISFFHAISLCYLMLFSADRFLKQQKNDNQLLQTMNEGAEKEPGSIVLRRAFFMSFLLVAASGVLGYLCSFIAATIGSCAITKLTIWLQIVGACLLLWGTLFVRGWDIQTYGGQTLTERVNQWVYRTLYCIGTAVIVFSIAWPACVTYG